MHFFLSVYYDMHLLHIIQLCSIKRVKSQLFVVLNVKFSRFYDARFFYLNLADGSET